jgi:radical SAM/SPASM domain protein of ACGX system
MYPYFAFQWHITDECDQRCQHCYIFSENNNICLKSMAYEEMEKVVAGCMEMCKKLKRTPYFYITGGDPILHKDFWKLCALLKKHSIDFGILGNPFHLNDDVCKRLASYGCKKYQLSLDGMRETHDKFRKPGSFDTTLKKISCVRNAGMYCAIMSTVSCMNMDEFSELIDTVVAHHADVFAFGRYCPTSEQKSEEYHIEPLAYKAFLEKVWDKYLEHNGCDTTFQLKDHLWTLFLYEKGIFKLPEGMDSDTIYDGCHCGSGHITILPTGDVYACRRMESKIGNVFETSMYDLFTGRELDCYREYEKFEKCSKCELFQLCRGCPAVTFGYTGNMYAPDPQCWKEIKEDLS